MTWQELSRDFVKIVCVCGGPSKSGSGTLNVRFDVSGEIYVEMGTYDIPNTPSHVELGPFLTEDEAMIDVESKLKLYQKLWQRANDSY